MGKVDEAWVRVPRAHWLGASTAALRQAPWTHSPPTLGDWARRASMSSSVCGNWRPTSKSTNVCVALVRHSEHTTSTAKQPLEDVPWRRYTLPRMREHLPPQTCPQHTTAGQCTQGRRRKGRPSHPPAAVPEHADAQGAYSCGKRLPQPVSERPQTHVARTCRHALSPQACGGRQGFVSTSADMRALNAETRRTTSKDVLSGSNELTNDVGGD